MENYKKQTLKGQRGQATMLSFSIFLIFGLWAVFLLLRSENVHRASLKAAEQRHTALTRSRKVAEVLNQISLNNKNILVSLAIVGNAFSESYNIATLWYKSRMPWDGRNFSGISNIQQHEALAAMVFNDSDLRSELKMKTVDAFAKLPIVSPYIKIEDIVEDNFKALSKRSERAFKIAAGLTAQNRNLRDRLMHLTNLQHGVVVQSPFSNALCMATRFGFAATDVKYNSARCWLEDLTEWAEGPILDLRLIANHWVENHQKDAIGVLHIHPEKAADFLRAIRNTDTSNPEVDRRLKTFLQLVATPAMALSDSIPTQRAPGYVITAPTHFDLRLDSRCDAPHRIRELLSNVQWNTAIDCGVNINRLMKSFFQARWTPVILEFRSWNQL